MEQIKQLIEKILSFFDVDFSVDLSENEETLRVNLRMDDAGFLIGANGDNLKELEFLLRAVLQRQNYGKRIFLDINNYRRIREDNLKDLAKEIAALRSSRRRLELKLEKISQFAGRTHSLEIELRNQIAELVKKEYQLNNKKTDLSSRISAIDKKIEKVESIGKELKSI